MTESPVVEQRRWFGSAIGMNRPSRHLLRPIIVVSVLLIFVLVGITGYIEKWLWMRELDYTGIFWTRLSVKCAMFCAAFAFAFLYLWINLHLFARNSTAIRDGRAWRPAFRSRADADAQTDVDFSPRLLKFAFVVVSAGVAFFIAAAFYTEWDTYL